MPDTRNVDEEGELSPYTKVQRVDSSDNIFTESSPPIDRKYLLSVLALLSNVAEK